MCQRPPYNQTLKRWLRLKLTAAAEHQEEDDEQQ